MPTTAHASLTGADLHEPKGAASAASGTVYVANGSGSGTWTTLTALTGTAGKIEMFMTPIVPSGYLECDGTDKSRTTYSDLFTAITIQQTGTRTNSSTSVVSLSDTSNMKVGYYIGGSGIPTGTTVSSITGPTTLIMSASATSTGSNTIIVSPWPLGNGTSTFTLPYLTDTGRHPRARTSANPLGKYFGSQNLAHDHGGVTGLNGDIHTHDYSGNTGTESTSHTHAQDGTTGFAASVAPAVGTGYSGSSNKQTGTESATHFHGFSGSTGNANTTHSHSIGTTGGTEARPDGVALMFCVRY